MPEHAFEVAGLVAAKAPLHVYGVRSVKPAWMFGKGLVQRLRPPKVEGAEPADAASPADDANRSSP
jgi:hypothetical protein